MRYFLTTSLALFLNPVFSQDPEHYIEIHVTDTVDMPIERVIYLCAVQPDPAYYGSYDPSLGYKEKRIQQKKWEVAQDSLCNDQEDLKHQLAAQGYAIGYFKTTRYNVAGTDIENCNAGIPVEVRSTQELERLIAFISEKRNVSGTVWLWESDPLPDPGAAQRLFGIAMIEAERVAEAGGGRLGRMTMAKDEILSVPYNSAVPRTASGDWVGGVAPVRKTMTFRFALLADDNSTARP